MSSWRPKVIVLYGNIIKALESISIEEHSPVKITYDEVNNWFDGYTGKEDVVMFDGYIPPKDILEQLAGKYNNKTYVKISPDKYRVLWQPKKIYIISEKSPFTWYDDKDIYFLNNIYFFNNEGKIELIRLEI